LPADLPWAAVGVGATALPLVAHAAELAAHTIAGTPRLLTSLLASVTMSALATAFNLFAMRRGAFIVGDGARSLVDDLKELPRLIGAFVMAPIALSSRRRQTAGEAPSLPRRFANHLSNRSCV
jgi:hypothetical protein